MKRLFLVVVAVLFLLSSGCAARLDVRNAGLENIVQHNQRKGAKKHFVSESTIDTFFWGLISSDPPYLAHILRGHVAPGRQVADIEFRHQTKPHQIIFCLLTAAIYCPHQLIVDGDIF